MRRNGLDRRAFMQAVGYATAWQAMRGSTARVGVKPQFAYVGCEDAIRVFAIRDGGWRSLQENPSRFPSCLVMHPGGGFLYALNDVEEHEGLPQGTVEAYAISVASGKLTLLNRQPLALSATRPRHCVITPDGGHLVVAVYGGGAYNVLPIEPDGALGRVSGISKQIGCGLHPEHQSAAHPHSMICDAAGRYFLGSDFGCDRLNVFTVNAGGLTRIGQVTLPPGSGPGPLALHPSGSVLYILNELSGSVDGYRYGDGELGPLVSHVALPAARVQEGPGSAALAVHPSGKLLYGSGVIHTNADDSSFFTLDRSRSAVVGISVDPATGQVLRRAAVARVGNPLSLALKYS